jgi:ABC-type polysaccharide/polyol phosphate transport system ATPase subunit
LLQLICGILKPTSGSVEVNGRISALLELGAGFNPEFTGRENVYFQGVVIGIAKEAMELLFDDIAAFADIGDFIDQPVRTYSSGMFVRLAFAVAIFVEPDILVVDEALAVGDSEFQIKCLNRLQSLVADGTTLLFVSHNIYQIRRLCQRVFYLQNGSLRIDGKTNLAIEAYENSCPVDANGQASHDKSVIAQSPEFSFTSIGIEIERSETNDKTPTIPEKVSFTLRIEYSIANVLLNGLQIGLILKTQDGQRIFGLTSVLDEIDLPSIAGRHVVKVEFNPNLLLPGRYLIGVSAFDIDYKHQYGFLEPAVLFRIKPVFSNGLNAVGTVSLPRRWHIDPSDKV